MHSGWRHSSCKIRTITLSLWLPRCLACTANDGCTVRISSAGNLITVILTNFGGEVRHFVRDWPNIAGNAYPASPVPVARRLCWKGHACRPFLPDLHQYWKHLLTKTRWLPQTTLWRLRCFYISFKQTWDKGIHWPVELQNNLDLMETKQMSSFPTNPDYFIANRACSRKRRLEIAFAFQ